MFPIVKESFPLSELLLGRKLVDTHETSLVGKRDTTQGTQQCHSDSAAELCP